MKLKYNDDIHAYWLEGKRCKGVTTIAKIPDSTYYLDLWQKRMVAIGLASDPRLINQVAAHLADKEKLDRICEKAQEAAKAHHAAEAGTTAHRFTEAHDAGEAFLETELGVQVIKAWTEALDAGGYETVDGMVERIAVLPDQKICGTFDRILRRKADGRLFIADLKTGEKAINYPHAIAVQLAVYANAPLLAGPLSAKGETTEFEPFPDVDKQVGIVIHMPTPELATLVEFDIAAGWEAFTGIIVPTLKWRDRKDLTKVSTLATVEPRGLAPVAPGAEVVAPSAPNLERRVWLINRIKALSDAGRKVLAAQWPDSVPTFKQSDGHTDEQLHFIEVAIVKAEAEVDAPFGPSLEEPKKITRHTPADPFDGLSGEAWDEGGEVSAADVDAFKEMYQGRPPWERPMVDVWARLCFEQGGRSLSLKQKATRWRYSVLCALLHAARAGCDDAMLLNLCDAASGSHSDDATPIGLMIADLTIAEADRVAHLARHLGTDALILEFTPDGKPAFSGSAYDGTPSGDAA